MHRLNTPHLETSHLETLWQQFATITKLAFTTHARKPSDWNGRGQGLVSVNQPHQHSIIFHESGIWQSNNGRQSRWTNIWQWSRHLSDNTIGIAHLRLGVDKPVHLLNLITYNGDIWQSTAPHRCGNDDYTATMTRHNGSITIQWHMQGPNKDAMTQYRYW